MFGTIAIRCAAAIGAAALALSMSGAPAPKICEEQTGFACNNAVNRCAEVQGDCYRCSSTNSHAGCTGSTGACNIGALIPGGCGTYETASCDPWGACINWTGPGEADCDRTTCTL